jgi:hypothetical protein
MTDKRLIELKSVLSHAVTPDQIRAVLRRYVRVDLTQTVRVSKPKKRKAQ